MPLCFSDLSRGHVLVPFIWGLNPFFFLSFFLPSANVQMLLFIASLGWILPKALCSTPTSLLPVYWRWPATYVILYELSNSASFRLPADLLMFTERKKKKKAVIVTRAWVNIVELLLLQDGILMFSAQFAYWLVGWPWRKCTRTGIDFIQLVTNSSQPCTGKKRASVRYTPPHHLPSPIQLFLLFIGLYSEFSLKKTMPSFMDERSRVCQNRVI